LTAVGTAISLTSSHEVVLVEQLWNPEENLQAVKRIHRIGQEHPCRARMFFAPSSIDDAVASVLARKMRLLGEIFHS
jgi:SNF2 family DNA or RNA helicase